MKPLVYINMKSLLVFFLLVSLSFAASGQRAVSPERDISLKVLDHKGRPVNRVMAHSLVKGNTGRTGRTGLYVFKNMADNDTLAVMLPRFGVALIPVSGMDSIVVTVRSALSHSYVDSEGQIVIVDKSRVEPNTILNVEEMMKTRSYNSLAELLQGRVSGLAITPGHRQGDADVTMRGAGSQPLIVLNGMVMQGSFQEIDANINVNEIKTIEILKSAAEWGTRGANGVIKINTK